MDIVQRSLVIFHRDLRLHDNTALLAALKASKTVIPCFIIDPQQIEQNPYKGNASLQFMCESLEDLQEQLTQHGGKLFLFYGDTKEVIKKVIAEISVDALYYNVDYTPFAQQRDQAINALCQQHNVAVHAFDDLLLQAPGLHLKQVGTPFLVFTAFYNHARTLPVKIPVKNTETNYYQGNILGAEQGNILERILPQPNAKLAIQGGRKACIDQLNQLKVIKHYVPDRDFPSKQCTTQLSAHLKFGTCSVREIYHAIQKRVTQPEELLRQLYWREFFTIIVYHFPYVLGHAFQKKYDRLKWSNDKKLFTQWCEGKTGFPIVDAGMRELNTTGYMHNRLRLITASFLIKDLHIDWRWGERYFAQQLVDYDPAVNNGNWQWVASTGVDHQPYFRIFNPWLQQKKFDPDCEYIKHWLPELKNLPVKTIHEWYKLAHPSRANYPAPMVDHSTEAAQAKAMYGINADN